MALRLVPSTTPLAVEDAPLPVSTELVAGLENLLGLAREGALTSMAAALVYHDGSTDNAFDIAAEDSVVLLAGVVALLARDIAIYEGASDDEFNSTG